MSTIGNNPSDFAIVDRDNYTTVDKSIFIYYLLLILIVTETCGTLVRLKDYYLLVMDLNKIDSFTRKNKHTLAQNYFCRNLKKRKKSGGKIHVSFQKMYQIFKVFKLSD